MRVPLPVVTIQQLSPPTFTPNRPIAPDSSWAEIQCIAQNEVTDEWPDGHLNAWLSRGWTLTSTIRRGPNAFHYLRRSRPEDSKRG